MSTFADRVRETPPVRDPAYRPAMYISDEEKAELDEKIGDANLYQDLFTMREMVRAQPENIELKKALVSGIASAEFAGIDAFSRKVVEWQEWPGVPQTLIMAIARQTWDEVRHAHLAQELVESYGGKIGEYPDTLAGGAPPPGVSQSGPLTETLGAGADQMMRDPVVSLSMINVSLEGGALALFAETSKVGEKIGDHLMAHCYDYNWADEVTHTAIGDYFVKELTADDPEAEQRALRVHGMSEMFRARLNGQQSQELKEFFADEFERANVALGGNG